MAALDYQETINYSFVEERWEHGSWPATIPIRVLNPIAAPLAVMRSSLMGSLVGVLRYNLARKAGRVRVFELAVCSARPGRGRQRTTPWPASTSRCAWVRWPTGQQPRRSGGRRNARSTSSTSRATSRRCSRRASRASCLHPPGVAPGALRAHRTRRPRHRPRRRTAPAVAPGLRAAAGAAAVRAGPRCGAGARSAGGAAGAAPPIVVARHCAGAARASHA
jgi:hypothetical protein